MSRLRVALVQLAADHDVVANLDRAAALVRRAGESKPGLIALPRCSTTGARSRGSASRPAHSRPHHGAVRGPGPRAQLLDPARQPGRAVRRPDAAVQHVGSAGPAARSARHTESATLRRGDRRRAVRSRVGADHAGRADRGPVMEGIAQEVDVRLGMSICFDLRFRSCTASLQPGGRDHGCRRTSPSHGADTGSSAAGRAIENGSFVIAPPSAAAVAACRPTAAAWSWIRGHGDRAGAGRAGVVVADLDLERVLSVRRQLPTQPGR